MSQSENDNNPRHHLLAKLALLAHRGKKAPQGDIPTDEDLALLYDNQLDFKRRQQVMSHINSNPELFKQWIALVDLLAQENNTHTSTASNRADSLINQLQNHWQALVGTLAVAGLATLVVLLQPDSSLIPNIDNSPSVATTESTTNIEVAPFISPDTRAMLAGIQSKATDNTLLLNLDYTHAIDQQGSSFTPALYQQYYQLGQQIAELSIHCEMGKVSAPMFDALKNTIQTIQQQSFIPLPAPLISLAEKTESQACNTIKHFLLSNF